ncbi:MAG TPA: hypothetical protein VE225_05135, partial [Rubrobacteraceae bacterium]|nr:hypothetical protein [Rubrobacteraceae bacterium]
MRPAASVLLASERLRPAKPRDLHGGRPRADGDAHEAVRCDLRPRRGVLPDDLGFGRRLARGIVLATQRQARFGEYAVGLGQ